MGTYLVRHNNPINQFNNGKLMSVYWAKPHTSLLANSTLGSYYIDMYTTDHFHNRPSWATCKCNAHHLLCLKWGWPYKTVIAAKYSIICIFWSLNCWFILMPFPTSLFLTSSHISHSFMQQCVWLGRLLSLNCEFVLDRCPFRFFAWCLCDAMQMVAPMCPILLAYKSTHLELPLVD